MYKCKSCPKILDDGRFKLCKKCRIVIRKAVTKKHNNRKAKGLCVTCGDSNKLKDIQICFVCWIRRSGYTSNGSNALWTREEYKELVVIWNNQDGRCIYTGEQLIAGKNASLDHIIPICKGGKDCTSNAQFVTKRMNRIKNDLSHNEFVQLCGKIYHQFCSIELDN